MNCEVGPRTNRTFSDYYKVAVIAEYDAAPWGSKMTVLERENLWPGQVHLWRNALRQGRMGQDLLRWASIRQTVLKLRSEEDLAWINAQRRVHPRLARVAQSDLTRFQSLLWREEARRAHPFGPHSIPDADGRVIDALTTMSINSRDRQLDHPLFPLMVGSGCSEDEVHTSLRRLESAGLISGDFGSEWERWWVHLNVTYEPRALARLAYDLEAPSIRTELRPIEYLDLDAAQPVYDECSGVPSEVIAGRTGLGLDAVRDQLHDLEGLTLVHQKNNAWERQYLSTPSAA